MTEQSNCAARITKTVIVLGPPRSGTSMTAGVLSKLGVCMGDVRPADMHNAAGYYEDRDFLALNDSIFAASRKGAHGFHAPSRDEILAAGPDFDRRVAAVTARKAEGAAGRPWGWKATGTCLTFDLFFPHLKDPHIIGVFRNPLQAAESARRYTRAKSARYSPLTTTEALGNVLRYQNELISIVARYADIPHYFVSYEHMCRRPRREIDRLCTFLDLTPPGSAILRARMQIGSRGSMKVLALGHKIKWYFNKRSRSPRRHIVSRSAGHRDHS